MSLLGPWPRFSSGSVLLIIIGFYMPALIFVGIECGNSLISDLLEPVYEEYS